MAMMTEEQYLESMISKVLDMVYRPEYECRPLVHQSLDEWLSERKPHAKETVSKIVANRGLSLGIVDNSQVINPTITIAASTADSLRKPIKPMNEKKNKLSMLHEYGWAIERDNFNTIFRKGRIETSISDKVLAELMEYYEAVGDPAKVHHGVERALLGLDVKVIENLKQQVVFELKVAEAAKKQVSLYSEKLEKALEELESVKKVLREEGLVGEPDPYGTALDNYPTILAKQVVKRKNSAEAWMVIWSLLLLGSWTTFACLSYYKVDIRSLFGF